jgi:hypothetical protein
MIYNEDASDFEDTTRFLQEDTGEQVHKYNLGKILYTEGQIQTDGHTLMQDRTVQSPIGRTLTA